MLKSIFKKRISQDKLTNALLNSLVKAMEEGFGDIAELINNDTDFIIKPEIKNNQYDKFLFILFVGNLTLMKRVLNQEEAILIKTKLIKKFSQVYCLTEAETLNYIKEYSDFMSRVNYPSKNILYGMSKSIFYKYNLSQYQEEYFKELNTPNPMFLKRLNEIVQNFIWDWDYFTEKVKMV